jgi:hypothetical protein
MTKVLHHQTTNECHVLNKWVHPFIAIDQKSYNQKNNPIVAIGSAAALELLP